MDKYNEDRLFTEKMKSLADEKTIDWMQKKSSDFIKNMTYYRCAIMEIETKFNVLNEEFSLEHNHNPINTIKTRLKGPLSIKNKLERRGFPLSIDSMTENLNDIAGVRVICSFKSDVYLLAQALLTQDDIELIRERDYIKNPKANGYRSLHLLVGIPIFLAHEKHIMKVEIQLRTIAMDFWASLEHQLRYKKEGDFSEEMMGELYECAQLSDALDQRMDNLREKALASPNKKS